MCEDTDLMRLQTTWRDNKYKQVKETSELTTSCLKCSGAAALAAVVMTKEAAVVWATVALPPLCCAGSSRMQRTGSVGSRDAAVLLRRVYARATNRQRCNQTIGRVAGAAATARAAVTGAVATATVVAVMAPAVTVVAVMVAEGK
jgi:hypothetical protein